ncbi:MAG: hypothetical protein RLO54_42395, partial [Sandaracinaceae bacterium]
MSEAKSRTQSDERSELADPEPRAKRSHGLRATSEAKSRSQSEVAVAERRAKSRSQSDERSEVASAATSE